MCGRLFQTSPPERVREWFKTANPAPNFASRHNGAPTQQLPVVRLNPETGERNLDLLRWGMIPRWAKDAKIGSKLINARSETVADKPSFRDAYRKRRCLVPVDGFYEWKRAGGARKQPYAFALKDEAAVMAFAGLWENWKSPEGEWVRSFTIITTSANELAAAVHDRMPVILAPEGYATWLGEEPAEPEAVAALLRPYPADGMRAWPVSTRVNNVRNTTADLLDPVEAERLATANSA